MKEEQLFQSIESRLMAIENITHDLEYILKTIKNEKFSEDLLKNQSKYKKLVIDLKCMIDMSVIELNQYCND